MEHKQTAVEWLVQEINKINVSTEARMFINKLKDQAKEMEKQQIVNAHLIGLIRHLEIEATKQAEQYYNEEYAK